MRVRHRLGADPGAQRRRFTIRNTARAAVVALALSGIAAGCGDDEDDAASRGSGSSTQEAAKNPATGSEIVIGDVSETTGPLASSNAGWSKGLKVWADWTNDNGGILGHKVVIEERDTKSDPTTLLSATKELLANPKVVAFIPGASQGEPISKLIAASKIPAVGGFNADPLWFTNPNVFPVGTTADRLAIALAQVGADATGGKAEAADLYCAEAPSCKASLPLFDAGLKQTGGKLVYQASVAASAPNYTAQCLAAKKAGANVMWIANTSATYARIAADCVKNGFKPQFLTPLFAKSYLEEPAVDGMKAVFPIALYNSPAADEFNKAVEQYAPGLQDEPFGGTIPFQAWTTGKLLTAAIEAAKPSGDVTAADVRKGLFALKDETLGGLTPPLTYTEGKPTSIPCFFVGTLSDGELKPEGTESVCPKA